MKKDAVKLVESITRKLLKENQLDSDDAKVVADMVKALAALPYVGYRSDDKFLKDKYEELSGIRIELMKYLEANSNYKFVAAGNGWKLTKK